MKNKLRKRLAALALCGVMIFSGSASALADSPVGEIIETEIVQEEVEQEVIVEEADSEVSEEVVVETPDAEVTEEVTEEMVEETTQPTIVETVVEAVQTAAETVVEVVETIIEYIIGTHNDLTYKDDKVIIKVYAEQDEIIPKGTKIKVVPILQNNEETKAQYEEVANQLQEKAAADEQVVEGFLAYDISLVDSEGNEFEPNGEVKVSIEYKEATLPEEVESSDSTYVTVHHFEEDVNGAVTEIVDMVAEAVVDVTEAVEVEKVEFKTNSFSVFTITWTGSNRTATITVHYVDKDGNAIEDVETDNVTLTTGNSLNVSSYEKTIAGYSFLRIDFDSIGSNKTASYIRVNNNTLQYANNRNSNSWTTWEQISSGENASKDIYIVYESLQPIATVDTTAKHVNISLTDYDRWSASSVNHQVITNINDDHALKFVTTGNELREPAYNVYTGGSSPYKGIVKNNLTSSGFPYLAVADESLEYLFNTTGKTYSANNLFKEVDGYYIYDSASNFAEFDTVTGNFTVYGQSKVGFFPFNKFTDNVQANQTSQNATTNHHFGMHVDYTFMQPASGKTDGSAMIFEFKGDDDVWVFIDGMLVLDIGGIHQSSRGTINFEDGTVTYSNASDTTIYAMYLQAWGEAGYDETEIAELTEQYFILGESGNYVFKDYSQHKLDFFYLERGAHDTNCYIKFNLIAIPKNTISIEKEITKSNMANFADAEFEFQIEKKDVDADGNYPKQGTLLANTTYKLYSVDANGDRVFIENRTTDADGKFTLKHRQVAEFSNIYASTKYCVTELGVTSEVYDKVDVNGSDIQIKDSVDENGVTRNDYTTGDLLAQEYVYAKFGNQCNVSNLRNLIIEKQLAGNQTTTDTFDIKVEFAEGDGWVPFVGTYFLDSSTGTAVTTNNGIITLAAGQSAYILGLISGTEYRVTEVLTAEQELNYATPMYDGAEGTIELGDVTQPGARSEYKATVTNTLLTKTVNVTKVWSDTEATHNPIYVGLYKKVNGQWQATDSYAELTEAAWTVTFSDLDLFSEYNVKELIQAENGEFTINDVRYTATEDYYSVGSKDYAVSYEKVDERYLTTVTITNTLLDKIEVEKVWNDGDEDHTNDIVYVGLYKVYEDQEKLVAVKELTATAWETVFDKLEISADYTYAVKELVPGENNSYTAINEGEIYTNGTFEYTVAYTNDGDSKVVITNTIKGTVVVEKIWVDADNVNGKRPETLEVYLKDGNEVVATVTLGKDKQDTVETLVVNGKTVRVKFTTDWSATLYGVDSEEYTFEEATVEGYVSSKVVEADKVTFTNTFNILIIKESLTGKFALEGAIFKITQGETTYYSESSAAGLLDVWYAAFDGSQVSQAVDTISDGTYVLSELVAPAGYMVSDAQWTIQVANGRIVYIDGATLVPTYMGDGDLSNLVYTVSYVNEALYELPSTGGFGIYVPMFSGVVMMMAAAFILMTAKRREA